MQLSEKILIRFSELEPGGSKIKDSRPNILFALADDASDFGTYGHKHVKTPNIDRVANNGVKFLNAFTTNPKCAPSRASILTGMHTWQLEEACNHFGVFPSKFSVFPDILEENGYHVGYTGKGWAPGDYLSGGFKRNPAGPAYNGYKLEPPSQTGLNVCDYSRNFADFIDKKPDDCPFLFWYGGFEPHRPYVKGEGARSGRKIEDIDYIPSYWPDNQEVREDILDYLFEIEWFDKHLGEMFDKLEQIGELDNTIIIVTSDNGMPFPRIKGQMYEQDFHLPMVACHINGGKHGRVVEDMISFVDIAPTILEAAKIKPYEQMSGRSFMDVIDSDTDKIVDERRNRAWFGREKHDLGRRNDLGYPVRCIRTKEYLYVRNFAPDRWPSGDPETYFTNCDSSPTKDLIIELKGSGDDTYYDLCFGKRPPEELYDIRTDPECVKNLALCDENDVVKDALWDELKAFLIKTGDPRILGNGDIFESYEYKGADHHSWRALEENRWIKQKH